jgi:hypothetical protein
MKLSHSRVEKYLSCPRSHELYYNKKIRPTTTTSALYFGGKLGLVLAGICLRKKVGDYIDDEFEQVTKALKPFEYFDELLETVEINGVEEELAYSPNIRYYRKDFNRSILTEDDVAEISDYAKELGLFLGERPATFDDFIEEYLSNQVHDTDILSFLNLHFFLSLRRKGQMMLHEFLYRFFHKIVAVHSIEREIQIDMSLAVDEPYTDSMIGFIDIECDYKLCEEYDKKILKMSRDLEDEYYKFVKRRVSLEKAQQTAHKEEMEDIVVELNELYKKMAKNNKEYADCLKYGDIIKLTGDFKTSSTRYGTKKLTESSQLARYNFVAQNPYQGYIVFVKTLKCPKNGLRKGELHSEIQVLFGNRDEELENAVLDEDEVVLEKIEAGEFPKIDEKSCQRIYGARCPYYNYCWDNKNMQNLTKKLDSGEISG